jgi:2-amino-4-hydroxy-6-hydroxymethyldihydropteridine diphosphokinase
MERRHLCNGKSDNRASRYERQGEQGENAPGRRCDAHARIMIFIGIGSNRALAGLGGPVRLCRLALERLQEGGGVRLIGLSPFYRSAPQPPSDQPWFVNAVANLETTWPPEALLHRLHAVEAGLGRRRLQRNESRTIDLDLLDYRGCLQEQAPTLPHPRMTERAFVLRPLADLAPDWRHPTLGLSAHTLLGRLGAEQSLHRLGGPFDASDDDPLDERAYQA